MTNLLDLARQFAAANPLRDGATWSGWCASLIYRFIGAGTAYNSATLAGDAAGSLNSDHTAAPIGALHYWAGANGDGHVAIDVAGRGRLLFMASSKVTESLGTAIGLVSFDDYQSKAGLPYRGWAMQYGANPTLSADDTGSMGDPAPAEELPAPVPAVRTYTVVEGDWLIKIAGEQLGDEDRWREIYDLNRELIGDNPDLIHPGQVFRLP